ncbi:MAG: DUF1080 domain-containing protein [Planctomycetaceae bacterium]|jgi:hypothetical protein
MPKLIDAIVVAVAVCLSITSAVAADQAGKAKSDATPATKEQDTKKDWKPLFNGRDLKGWKVSDFGGEGQVNIGPKGEVVIHEGVDLSGITTTRKDLPTTNYEVEFEAQRAKGTDFFVGYTFPVGDSACSLVLGGWGGGVCGISSLDFMDASENETTSYQDFTRGKWYKVRVRVTDSHIKAWVGKWTLADVERSSYKIDVRFEMEVSKPMGFATYQTVGKIRNARMRTLSPEEAKANE